MARRRGENEVVTHGGISGPFCGIMSQTVEATKGTEILPHGLFEYLVFTYDCVAVN